MARLLETHLRHRQLRYIKETGEIRFRRPSKIFGQVLSKRLGYEDPALFTNRSMRPKSRIAAATTRCAVSGRPMSPSTSFRAPVASSVMADVIFREFATTRYPFAASLFVTSRPIPLEAPVTIATLEVPVGASGLVLLDEWNGVDMIVAP